MDISIDSVKLKVKGNNLVLKTGLLIEDTIAKIPLDVVPSIKWDKTVETILIQELIRKKRLDIVLQMSGHTQEEPVKKFKAPGTGSAGNWSEDQKLDLN